MFNMSILLSNIFIGQFWSILPAIAAIIIALITRQVYIALFSGIFIGAMFLSYGDPIRALLDSFYGMAESLGGQRGQGGSFNGGILIFILMLGVIVILLTRSGATKAFADVVSSKIKSRKGAQLATAGFGVLIFMDDAFNRMTVGKVMKGITDKFRISRVKLAYIVGTVSVAICVLIPISSWAGAISSNIVQGLDDAGTQDVSSFNLFLQTIMYNFYPFLALILIFAGSALRIDFPAMRKRENHAIKTGDLFFGKGKRYSLEDNFTGSGKGKPFDLVIPVLMLIFACVGLMIYTGYMVENGVILSSPKSISLMDAFNQCDLGVSLSTGSAITVVFMLIMYLPRKLISFKDFSSSLAEGFMSVAEVIMILILAWTLSSICDKLDVSTFVSSIAGSLKDAIKILPAAMFLISLATSFSIGTAWGTFGILVPLVIPMLIFEQQTLIIGIAAVLSGACFGNQVSPISDVTILASASTGCDHMDYVKTQLPYAISVAIIAFFGFLMSGLFGSPLAGWITCLCMITVFLVYMFVYQKKNDLLLPKVSRQLVEKDDET
jgi:Na+/H+ antiporter NhaC